VSLLVIVASHLSIAAQQPAAKAQQLGIALYLKGDTKEAIKELSAAVKKNNADSESWYYLGLAYIRDNDYKNARKAFEKAAQLTPTLAKVHSGWAYVLLLSGKNEEAEREAGLAIGLNQQDADAHYVMGVVRLRQRRNPEAESEAETAISLNSGLAVAYLLKSQALVAIYSDRVIGPVRIMLPYRTPTPITEEQREALRNRNQQNRETLSAAATALETYLSLSGTNGETELWRDQLKTLKVYAANDESEEKVYSGSDVTTRVKILAKPEAPYTEAARRAGVGGTVLLSLVLTADGQVKHIMVLRGLPLGLTEESIVAARKIKFVPATKDGKAVSVMVHVEYSFYIY
jgi:TonB family protein